MSGPVMNSWIKWYYIYICGGREKSKGEVTEKEEFSERVIEAIKMPSN